MEGTLAVRLPNDGMNMAVCEEFLYVLLGKQLRMFALPSMEELARAEVLARQGRARDLLVLEGRVWIRDFCDLHEVDARSLALLHTWRVGQDASSDICAFSADGKAVYCCLRGGGLAVMDKDSGDVRAANPGGGSAWDITSADRYVFFGTTAGEVVKLRKDDLVPDRRKAVHRKNIYGLLRQPGTLYTISGDGFMMALDPDSLEVRNAVRMAHKGMCAFCGIWREFLVTSDPKRREILFWSSFRTRWERVISFPAGGLSRHGIILAHDLLIGSDPQGIHVMDLARQWPCG